MRSIRKKINQEIVINKSSFINYTYPVSDISEVTSILEDLRKKYQDANHHCYAYIIGDHQEIQKFSDDGEPSKTAGMPMIEVLKKQDLTNVLSVTIRYFGGIKLGAGGLVRAYTKSVSESLKLVEFSYLTKYQQISITVPFDQIGNVEKYIRDHYTLVETLYTDQVNYIVELLSSDTDEFLMTIKNNTNGKAVAKLLQEFEKYE